MIECPICNRKLSKIDKQHLKAHGFSKEEYFEQFGNDAPFGYSPELKAKKSGDNHPLKGKGHSEETKTKAKLVETTKKLWQEGRVSDKQKNGIGQRSKEAAENGEHFNTGRTHERSDEYREKLSIALNEYYHNNPKPPLSDERMEFQIPHLEKIAKRRKEETAKKLETNLQIEWGEVLENSEHFISGNFRFSIKCSTCNNVSNVALVTLKKHQFANTLCHTCFPPLKGESKAEVELADFVSQYVEIVRHNKSILPNNLELDIYIPSKNIAIEYHGLYWHSSKAGYDRYKHRKKYELCKERGIRLVQIFEDEWLSKKDLVKNKIINIIGCNVSTKLFARKLQAKIISSNEATLFLNQYHIQGSAKSKVQIGLFTGIDLVAVMTFCRPRIMMNQIDDGNTWELLRYATHSDYQIIGGAGKLLSCFIKNNPTKKIISWADLRWTDYNKNVYQTLGFSLVGETKIGVFFTNFTERKHRWGFRRPAHLGHDIITKDYWDSLGWYSISDAGQLKYQLELSDG